MWQHSIGRRRAAIVVAATPPRAAVEEGGEGTRRVVEPRRGAGRELLRGSEEHEGTPLGGEARGRRRRGRRRGQRAVFRQSPLAVIAGKIPAELPLFPERRWRRPDDGVDAAVTPPVGGRPGQPAAAKVHLGDESIVIIAQGGGGESATVRRRDDNGQGPWVEFGGFGDGRGR